jgi:hypothetical protein
MDDDVRRLALIGVRSEIVRLNALRAQLEGGGAAPRRPVGRPKGTGSRRSILDVTTTAKRKRRKMSAAGRKRISDMMKKRWAERRKAGKAK